MSLVSEHFFRLSQSLRYFDTLRSDLGLARALAERKGVCRIRHVSHLQEPVFHFRLVVCQFPKGSLHADFEVLPQSKLLDRRNSADEMKKKKNAAPKLMFALLHVRTDTAPRNQPQPAKLRHAPDVESVR